MSNLTKINQSIGRIVSFGFVIAQILIMVCIDPHVVLIGLLTAGIFLPFFVIGIVSILDRTKYDRQIKTGLKFGIGLLIVIPIVFPLFFDKEFIFISLLGIVLGILMWYLRNKIEILFLIFNSISGIMLLILLIGGIFST